jgi:anaphase-promoting complex subunit 10
MESDGEEEAAGTPGPTTPAPASGRLKGCPELSVDADMREMAKTAAWSVSSCKPGNGVASLRDDSLDTYWQSVPYPPIPHLNLSLFSRNQKLNGWGFSFGYLGQV